MEEEDRGSKKAVLHDPFRLAEKKLD